MSKILALAAALALISLPVVAQSMLPRCSARLDGQVSVNGCSCGYDPGGQLSARPAGWRWSCDLLHAGSGEPVPSASAGYEPPGLPPGFVYAPQISQGTSTAANTATPTMGLGMGMNIGRSMRY